MDSEFKDRKRDLASFLRDQTETRIRYETIAMRLDSESERANDPYHEISIRAELFEEAAKIDSKSGRRAQARINFSVASERRALSAARHLEVGDFRHAAQEFARASEDAELANNTSKKKHYASKAAENYIIARDNADNFDDMTLFGIHAANNMSKAGIFSINGENVREVHARAVSDYESSSKHPIVRILINRSPLSRGRLF